MRSIVSNRILRSPSFRYSLVVKRQSPGRYVEGVWVPGETTEETTIGGSVPYSLGGHTRLQESAKMKNLTKDGSRIVEVRRFFLQPDIQPLRTVENQETDGDIIVFNNKEYRVYIVEEWRNFKAVYGIVEERIPE